MLAYVFWHSPAARTDPGTYESLLAAFHESLATSEVEGLASSAAFLVQGASWLEGVAPTYEDWYLLEDFAALGRLNEAAVGGGRKAPHDAVAAKAGAGAAGVYALLGGAAPTAGAELALWFPKPPGHSYADIVAWASGKGALWQRQMTLGPSPELCLLCDRPLDPCDEPYASPLLVVARERTIVPFAA